MKVSIILASLFYLSHPILGAFVDVIPASSLSSQSNFDNYWLPLYPWGSDHNGAARMKTSNIGLKSGILTLTATRLSKSDGTSGANPHPTIWYYSGAVHAKSQILVTSANPNYEIRGDFKAPAGKGAWPAFWLTAVVGWPPEIDVLEFKGDNINWFNTFRTSSDVTSTKVSVGSPDSQWHTYRIWMTKVNDADVDVHFYVDGVWKAKHSGKSFVGKAFWLIMNLQMEGSSGSPGPNGNTIFQGKNIYVGKSA
ncbi:hypothetical protein HK096_003763 [Nowakowskiella sp. JEL0078]|nr:hypothetical protein HK096_003763 [Nowakowskiella sp. JEL0078]